MITEDYVSFETAKLLKEKGFDEYCLKNYQSSDKELHDWKWELSYKRNSDGNRNTKDCAAPTFQMAMKWLREVKGLYIDIITLSPLEFNFSIVVVTPERTYLDNACEGGECYLNHQDACEAAIKYCLESLI